MTGENDSSQPVSRAQEKLIIGTFSYIHKLISRKLGAAHGHALEDIKQRVFLKLWRWQKRCANNRDLSNEDWQKMAHVTAQNEVKDYFRKKDNLHVQFSQLPDGGTESLAICSPQVVAGNSLPEIRSLLALVWIAAQTLSIKQKYSYFLQFHDIIVEFLYVRCCSIEELAKYFEVTEIELSRLIEALPLPDHEIAARISDKTGARFSLKNVYVSRSRAKTKLAGILKEFIFNDGTSI